MIATSRTSSGRWTLREHLVWSRLALAWARIGHAMLRARWGGLL